MKNYFFFFVLLFSSISVAQERSWTSADGKKEIQANFIEYDATNDIVVIKNKNKEQRVKLSLFSPADRKWVKSQTSTADPFSDEANHTTPAFAKRVVTQQELNKLALEAEKLADSINSPVAYAHLLVIQSLSGQKEKTAKTLEKGLKCEIGAVPMGRAIAEIGDSELADILLKEVAKSGKPTAYIDCLLTTAPLYKNIDPDKSESLFKKAQTMLDADPELKKSASYLQYKVTECLIRMDKIDEALSTIVKMDQKDNELIFAIGKYYLDNNKIDEANEMFEAAEDGTTMSMRIAELWLKNKKPHEARKLLDRFKNPVFKIIVLRFLAVDALERGNTKEALRLIEEALSDCENLFVNISNLYEQLLLVDLLKVLGENAKDSNAHKKIRDYIERAPDSNMKNGIKCELAIYTKLQGDEKIYHDIVKELSQWSSSPELVWIFWNSALNMLKLAGEEKIYEEYMTKVKRMGLTEKDEKRRKTMVEIYKRNENNKSWELFMPGDNYVRKLGFNQISRMEAPVVQWVHLGQIDKALNWINGIKLPEAKIDVIRLFVQENHLMNEKK